MSPKDDDITPAILLQHMQGMEQRLRTEFTTAIVASENRITADFSHKLVSTERNIIRQIDGIDERLDDIEVVQLPKVRKAVGIG